MGYERENKFSMGLYAFMITQK